MPTAKPAAASVPTVGHPLTPDYSCWLLTGTSPEADSLKPTSTAPLAGTGVSTGTNPEGAPCRTFAGTGELHPIANLNAYGTGDYTIVARIKPTSLGGYQSLYVGGVGLYCAGTELQMYSSGASSGMGLTNNVWSLVAMSRGNAGARRRYYKDGVQIGADVAAYPPDIPTGAGVGIGGYGIERFQGSIDLIYIYKSELSAANLLSLTADPFQMFASAAPEFNALMLAL